MAPRQRIFISYATEDDHFVPLAAKLLEVHDHRVWFAQAKLRGGELFKQRIDEELAAAHVLIVVVSRNAHTPWVPKEIATFKARRPDGLIIPLRLDSTHLSTISPDLPDHQAVDFRKCLLSGFQALFGALGNDFLSKKELANRRSGDDRRSGRDRRQASVQQRVSIGLLVTYTRETGKSVGQVRSLSPGDLEPLEKPLGAELRRYTFCDPRSNQEIEPSVVLAEALEAVRKRMSLKGPMDAVEALRTIAEHTCAAYDVRIVQRREGRRRR